jgi:hypothetical protein
MRSQLQSLQGKTRRPRTPEGVQVGGGQSPRLVAATATGQLQRRLVGLVSDRPRTTLLDCTDRRIPVRAFIDRWAHDVAIRVSAAPTRANDAIRTTEPSRQQEKAEAKKRATIGRAMSAPFAPRARCPPRSPSGLLRSCTARCHFCNHERARGRTFRVNDAGLEARSTTLNVVLGMC